MFEAGGDLPDYKTKSKIHWNLQKFRKGDLNKKPPNPTQQFRETAKVGRSRYLQNQAMIKRETRSTDK